MDISVLREIDKITESHLSSCPCCNEEIDKVAKKIALESVEEIKNNNLVKSSPSVGLDIIKQNRNDAIEVVASKYSNEPCKLQSQYAQDLWDGFSEKYDVKNPQVSLIVSSVIVMALKAYKMNGKELIYRGYDKYGNEHINLNPLLPESRRYLESLTKAIKTLDEIENGKKITMRTEVPSREEMFQTSKYIIIDEDDVEEK